MKILNLECFQESISLRKPFKTALRTVTDIQVVRIKLTLENGEIGWGAATPTWVITGESLASIKEAILGPIRDVVINQDINHFESILVDVQSCCIGNAGAKAGVDIALHDVYCRLWDIPLYQLLGGYNNQIETDITIGVDDPVVMLNDAQDRMNEGFNSLKIKVGNDEELDIRRIETIREGVGPDVLLRLDANQGWTKKQAVKIIQALENRELGVELIEQPVPAHDIEGLKFVTDRVNTPIMADESVFTPKDALHLLEKSAVDLLNIKLMKCGGIQRAMQIVAIAEAAGVECMIGSMMESSLSVTAAAHIAAAKRNITRYDLDAPLWLIDDSWKGGSKYEGKALTLSSSPGIGTAQQTLLD